MAFENSLFEDYITEKTFKVLYQITIPVIFAGVEISRFLPPKSYIDVNDFKTVEDLGKYLNFLSDNPKEYVKYFWWRKYYKVEFDWIDFCAICGKLNDPNLKKEKHVYEAEWFLQKKSEKPKIKF